MRWFLTLCCAFLLTTVAAEPLSKQNQAAFYIEKYGRLDSQHPQARQAQTIFERVSALADKKLNRWPQLVVIKSPNNHAPLALALADGSIILSQHALNLAFNADPTTGHARLAFILGHELAHLANGDFYHHSLFNQINGFKTIETQIQQTLDHGKELAADERGFIYAAMAGFAVDKLLQPDGQNRDFFRYWQQQLPSDSDKNSHPSADTRSDSLRQRLSELLQQLQFYYFGVRLSAFDRCDDAIYFFQAFQQHFPARELLNNLGYCYLQEARKELGNEAYTYWLPLLLDSQTQLAQLALPSGTTRNGSLSTTAKQLLHKAHEFLQAASEADPYYVPAWVNLAVSAFYADEIYVARAAIEQARELAPDDVAIQTLRALILYKEGLATDTWPAAITLLQQLASRHDNPLLHYNLARLLEERGRSGAIQQWQLLAKQAQQLPSPIQQQVCAKAACDLSHKTPKARQQWKTPLKLGQYIKRDPASLAVLKAWSSQDFDWQAEVYGTIYQHPQQKMALLALAGYSEMLVWPLPETLSNAQLQPYCDQPLIERPLAHQYTLTHCPHHWAALAHGQQMEIWLIR